MATERDGRQGIGGRLVEKLLREHVGLMSPAPSAQDERRFAAHLAASVIGDDTGSRLYYALVEPAIAEEAHCSYDPLDGSGAFVTFLVALTLLALKLGQVRETLPDSELMQIISYRLDQ